MTEIDTLIDDLASERARAVDNLDRETMVVGASEFITLYDALVAARDELDRVAHLHEQWKASVDDDYARIAAKQFRDKAAQIALRTEIESRLDLCRNPATVDVKTGEFKNPDTAGYSRALREVLTLLDGEKTV
jgi:hypothetical protein